MFVLANVLADALDHHHGRAVSKLVLGLDVVAGLAAAAGAVAGVDLAQPDAAGDEAVLAFVNVVESLAFPLSNQ